MERNQMCFTIEVNLSGLRKRNYGDTLRGIFLHYSKKVTTILTAHFSFNELYVLFCFTFNCSKRHMA